MKHPRRDSNSYMNRLEDGCLSIRLRGRKAIRLSFTLRLSLSFFFINIATSLVLPHGFEPRHSTNQVDGLPLTYRSIIPGEGVEPSLSRFKAGFPTIRRPWSITSVSFFWYGITLNISSSFTFHDVVKSWLWRLGSNQRHRS